MKAALLSLVLLALAAHANPARAAEWMRASWYEKGTIMADGERFNANDPTIVAHRSLPFGTELRLTNPQNDETIVVTVRDRGPRIKGRKLDLSRGAAKQLGIKSKGVTTLLVEVLN